MRVRKRMRTVFKKPILLRDNERYIHMKHAHTHTHNNKIQIVRIDSNIQRRICV